MIDERDHEYIREKVEDAMGYSMDMFSFDQIIDVADGLSIEEKQWAKKHLAWKVVIDTVDPCDKKKPRYYEHIGNITFIRS